MPAIITDELKQLIARDFFDQFVLGTADYYAGIGRSEQWDSQDTVPIPVNTPGEIEKFQNSLQAVKKIEGVSQVVPRNNWSSGQIYSQFDDLQAGYPANAYYVMNSNNHVYMCLETGRNLFGVAVPSTVEPTGSNLKSFRLADGYVWKFLYTISAARANDFMSSNFMPVQKQGLTDSNSTGIQLQQEEVQDAAVAGEILNIILVDGGVGYTSNPNITITGTGLGARAVCDIDSATGELVRIRMSDSGAFNHVVHGAGYTRAKVTITGGGATVDAKARAVIGTNDSGVGRDPRIDLKSAGIMFHSKLEGFDSDLIIDQDFRHVGLIRNPKDYAGSKFTRTTGSALKRMELSSIITAFTQDKIMEGATSLAQAYIDEVDSNGLYYHQTSVTGFDDFVDGELVEEINGAGEGIIDSAHQPGTPEVDPMSGAVLYIDNRGPIERSAAQSEDIKIIIQF
jgi:hypothetical protein